MLGDFDAPDALQMLIYRFPIVNANRMQCYH